MSEIGTGEEGGKKSDTSSKECRVLSSEKTFSRFKELRFRGRLLSLFKRPFILSSRTDVITIIYASFLLHSTFLLSTSSFLLERIFALRHVARNKPTIEFPE